jgi:hypothetical protein
VTAMKPSRRDFLGAASVAAALSPFVPFLNREAVAQAGAGPVRVMLLFTPNGSVPSEYWPQPGAGEADFTFKPGSITEPLAPFRSKLIFPRNMKRPRGGGGGHESAFRTQWTGAGQTGSGGGFGGYAKGPSVDQIIAKALPAGQTTFPSLQFGVQHDGPGANPTVLTSMTYSGANQPLPPESNPYTMFNRLMLGSGGAPTGISQEQLDRVRLRKKSVLDLVREDLRALAPRIDRSDRIKIEQHADGLTSIERRLNNPMNPVGGGSCGGKPARAGIDLKANDSYPELLGIQSSLAVAALACDRTRVASLQWSRSFSQVRHTWVGVSDEHHTLSHKTSAADQQKKFKIERWYGERMAELLRQMDTIPEGGGTLLDNTMLIYCNDLSEGAPHSVSPAICYVAGRAGGKIRTGTTGRLLEMGNYDFTQLLLTACHVMGVTGVNQIGELGKPGLLQPILT